MRSNVDLYLTGDRSTVVGAEDPRAAALLVNAGREIPDAEIVKIFGGDVLAQAQALGQESKAKQAAPPAEDKQLDAPFENKSRRKVTED